MVHDVLSYHIFLLKEQKAVKNFKKCHVFTVLFSGNIHLIYVTKVVVKNVEKCLCKNIASFPHRRQKIMTISKKTEYKCKKQNWLHFLLRFIVWENVPKICIWLLRFFKKYQFGELSGTEKACFCGCVQYVFLGLDLEYAINWTDLTRALRLLAGKSIKLHLNKLQKL